MLGISDLSMAVLRSRLECNWNNVTWEMSSGHVFSTTWKMYDMSAKRLFYDLLDRYANVLLDDMWINPGIDGLHLVSWSPQGFFLYNHIRELSLQMICDTNFSQTFRSRGYKTGTSEHNVPIRIDLKTRLFQEWVHEACHVKIRIESIINIKIFVVRYGWLGLIDFIS